MALSLNGSTGISGINGSAGTPALQGGDADTGIFFGTDTASISTEGIERLIVDANGNINIDSGGVFYDATNNRLAIGTTTVNANLHVGGSGQQHILIGSTDAGGARLSLDGDSNGDGTGGDFAEIIHTTSGHLEIRARNPADDATMRFEVDAGEAFRVDSSKRLLVGTSSAPTGGLPQFSRFTVSLNNDAASNGGQLNLAGNARGSLSTGDALGQLLFTDSTNGTYGSIQCQLDGTPGNGDYPGRLVFSTTADGASSPTSRMVITNTGAVVAGGTNTSEPSVNSTTNFNSLGNTGYIIAARSAATPLFAGRNTNDGALAEFRQDGTLEGSISVSGTTVSYNGGHISRWSQLPGEIERTEILRGSVLSNLDEMCEWGDEDNEQLNRMQVSSVEGDPNVSGVFDTWDDDDDTYTNDFYCAMTGDFIIRIGAGVTVERGDLLMSAGDGTAKPQDDDIIRSKTIAKVTSTNVSCTYDDGSYCVPCVLMAC